MRDGRGREARVGGDSEIDRERSEVRQGDRGRDSATVKDKDKGRSRDRMRQRQSLRQTEMQSRLETDRNTSRSVCTLHTHFTCTLPGRFAHTCWLALGPEP